MENILLAGSIDQKNIVFSENIKTLDSGGRSIFIGYNEHPLIIQTPEMSAPFGSSCWNANNNGDPTKDKYTLHMSFRGVESKDNLQKFQDFLIKFDDLILDTALERSVSWFKKKIGMKDVISALYTPLLRRSKNKTTGEYDDKYPPDFKINLPFKGDKFDFDIYNGQKELVELSSIPQKSLVTAIVQCMGVWIAGGKFGCTWKVIQLRVKKPASIQGFAFRQTGDSDEENDEENEIEPEKENEVKEDVDVDLIPAHQLIKSSDDEDDHIDKPPSKTGRKKTVKK